MRFLITNDDGIESAGLTVLSRWARTVGDVVIVAPKTQQSAKSQSIELSRHIEVQKVNYENGIEAYSVDSTPADCVRIALRGLQIQCDVILSGINFGWNIGSDIIYSGTCGAIFEASFMGKKGIAFSSNVHSYESAEENLGRVYNFILNNGLFSYNDIYNVNFPDRVKGIRVTRQGGHYYEDNFLPSELLQGHYKVDGFCAHDNKHDHEIDTDAVTDGYISVTPLTLDRTSPSFYKLSEIRDSLIDPKK